MVYGIVNYPQNSYIQFDGWGPGAACDSDVDQAFIGADEERQCRSQQCNSDSDHDFWSDGYLLPGLLLQGALRKELERLMAQCVQYK